MWGCLKLDCLEAFELRRWMRVRLLYPASLQSWGGKTVPATPSSADPYAKTLARLLTVFGFQGSGEGKALSSKDCGKAIGLELTATFGPTSLTPLLAVPLTIAVFPPGRGDEPIMRRGFARSPFVRSSLCAVCVTRAAARSRKHIADAIDRAQARSEAAARLLFSDLRPLFKWAHERELVDANPMTGLRAPKPAEARERTLEDDESRAFWQATDEASWPFASVYKLLLLTGARREEVAGMKWSELDLDAGVWMLPSARTKNSRDHRIPLARQAVAILDRRAIFAIKEGLGYRDSDLVFSTTGTTSPSGFSKAKRALDARMQEILGAKFKPWRVHDLRRTCATGMEHLGVDLRVIEAALNHVSGTKAGIVGVYQRAEHREAVRAAFEAWDSRVAELTCQERPSNVVSLSRA